MAIYKNVTSQKIAVFAYDGTTAAGSLSGKTGDAANITARISKDGGASAATNDTNPTELDATNHPGWYVFDLTQAETNADLIVLSVRSATSNILIDEIQILTLPEPVAITDVISDGNPLNATSGTLDAVTVAGSVTGAVGSVTGNVGGNVTGSVASVTGAVGSVTGNVGGNVAGSVASVTGAVGSVTGNVGGNVTGSIGSLAAQAKADINAEVLDCLRTDVLNELAAVPAANAAIADKINWLFLLARNKVTQDATTQTVFADDGSTALAESTVGTAAGTTTRGEFAAP